jgi:hypothetical protein
MTTTETASEVGDTRLIPPRPSTRAGRRLERITAGGGGRIDRFNRGLFLVVGVVLTAAGTGGLLLGEGAIDGTSPGQFYSDRVADLTGSPNLATAIAMACCLVLFLLALAWAFAQLRPVTDGHRLGTLTLSPGPRGRTTVASTTVAKAAAADIAGVHGVTSARVRLRALKPKAMVVLNVELALDADPDTVLAEFRAAVTRLLGAINADVPSSETEIRLRFARPALLSRSDRPARVT